MGLEISLQEPGSEVIYNCRCCEHQFKRCDADPICAFAETRLEPAEFIDSCPRCHSDNLEEIEDL